MPSITSPAAATVPVPAKRETMPAAITSDRLTVGIVKGAQCCSTSATSARLAGIVAHTAVVKKDPIVHRSSQRRTSSMSIVDTAVTAMSTGPPPTSRTIAAPSRARG